MWYGSHANNAHTRNLVFLHALSREITSTSYVILNLLCNYVATQLRYLKEKEDHKKQMTDNIFYHNKDML